jgi:quercetin dioxygenase-like cupin family protein
MPNHLISFDFFDWINAGIGCRYKVFADGNKQLRVVEFSEGFVEFDWCLHGHVGFVLDGEFSIDFSGTVERFRKGDIVYIPSGNEDKHKAILAKNEKVTLLLFEVLEKLIRGLLGG